MSLNVPPSKPPSAGRTISLVWVVVIALVVGGAAVAGTAVYFIAHSSSQTPGTLRITDDLGRTVTVPHAPARLAVLSPSIMDIVYRLGLRSHVVAVDCYANLGASTGLSEDYSPDQIARWNLSSSMCVQVGPTFVPEMLVNLTPQLVLASTIVSVSAVEEISNQLHVPVVMLQPPTLSGILYDDALVGEIFGVNSSATTLNAQLSAGLFNATNISGSAFSFPTVLVTYSVDSGGYWTFGPGTFGLSLIEISGATSISATATTPYPELSSAQVLLDNPQFIIYGTGFGLNESTFAGGPDWSQFAAVQAGNVSGINSNWLTEPDPTMILEGIPTLDALFHPA
ncbi:MAG: ABC transporter substrate-binding protein [Thermoplasmata archaeon]|nr:ABC transporter substrate-binding protein [Thermoplasmata archaeon]